MTLREFENFITPNVSLRAVPTVIRTQHGVVRGTKTLPLSCDHLLSIITPQSRFRAVASQRKQNFFSMRKTIFSLFLNVLVGFFSEPLKLILLMRGKKVVVRRKTSKLCCQTKTDFSKTSWVPVEKWLWLLFDTFSLYFNVVS